MAGCAWPSPHTAMPLKASRYLLPSVSHSQEPSPRSKVTGSLAYVDIKVSIMTIQNSPHKTKRQLCWKLPTWCRDVNYNEIIVFASGKGSQAFVANGF